MITRDITDEDKEILKIVKKMARAAGPQTPKVMQRACYILFCGASFAEDPEKYFEALDKHNLR